MSGLDPADLLRLAFTVAAGFGGAAVAARLRFPAGALIGPMLAVGALNLAGAPVIQLGADFRNAAQILIGATVAVTLTPAVAAMMLRLVGPALAGMAVLIVLGVLGGWTIHRLTGLPLASALFAGAPGGVVEMSLAAADVGGDLELVAAIQFARLLAVTTAVPILLRWAFRSR